MKESIKYVALAFIGSRALIFLVILIFSGLADAPNGAGDPPLANSITASAEKFAVAVDQLAQLNDADWYHGIATTGYERRPFDLSNYANWAFFPLHPLVWGALIDTFGDQPLPQILLSNGLFFLALLLIYRIALKSGRDRQTALRAIFIVCFFPTSYFFSMPWSESLFLFLSAACYLGAQNGRWIAMAILGALATATRFAGIFLVPAISLLYSLQQMKLRESISWYPLMMIALIPLGLIAFMIFLGSATGNYFAFSDIQAVWGRSLEIPFRALGIIFVKPHEIAVAWNVRYLNIASAALGLLATWHLIRRREFPLAALLLLAVAAPLLTGSTTSMARYLMASFPFALAAADWTGNKAVGHLWFGLSPAILALMSLAFAAGLNFAGT